MSGEYLKRGLLPRYVAKQQIKLRLSPGDGFKGLPLCPIWY